MTPYTPRTQAAIEDEVKEANAPPPAPDSRHQLIDVRSVANGEMADGAARQPAGHSRSRVSDHLTLGAKMPEPRGYTPAFAGRQFHRRAAEGDSARAKPVGGKSQHRYLKGYEQRVSTPHDWRMATLPPELTVLRKSASDLSPSRPPEMPSQASPPTPRQPSPQMRSWSPVPTLCLDAVMPKLEASRNASPRRSSPQPAKQNARNMTSPDSPLAILGHRQASPQRELQSPRSSWPGPQATNDSHARRPHNPSSTSPSPSSRAAADTLRSGRSSSSSSNSPNTTQLMYRKPWEAQLPWRYAQPCDPNGSQRSHTVDGYYTELDMLRASKRASPGTDPTPLSEYRTAYRHEQPAAAHNWRGGTQMALEDGLGRSSKYQYHLPDVAGRILRARINLSGAGRGVGSQGELQGSPIRISI